MKLFVSWRLRSAAKKYFGWSTLRPGQLDAMKAIASGRDAVVVLPTGAGKSAVYQVPASIAGGPTIVISPLLALQHDQVASLNARGITNLTAVRISSAQTPKQQAEALAQIKRGEAKLLFITPEQLASPIRVEQIRDLKPALVAVDEAHCVSSWGYDFRPDYLALGPVIEALGRPPIVALTATASPPVREDIAARLRLRKPRTIIGALDRPNLFLEAVRCQTEEQRWRRLRTMLDRRDGSGIIYVATRRAAQELAERLLAAGYPAAYYHGGMAAGLRKKRHQEFSADRVPIMVATSAFGMGIDKANIRWVTHMALPDSPDSYLQEIGRAGRDGAPARVLLLFRPEDMALQRFFNSGSPAIDELLFVAAAVRAGVKTKAEIATKTNLAPRKVAGLLNLLETVGAAVLGGRGEVRCPPFAPVPEDAAVLAAAEHDRHQLVQRSRTDMMRQFAETDACRVQPLLNYFGEQIGRRCGHCDNCGSGTRHAASRRRDQPFAPHALVRHGEWGRGTVLGYERDRMTVLFDHAGYKTLSVKLVRDNGLLVADAPGGDA